MYQNIKIMNRWLLLVVVLILLSCEVEYFFEDCECYVENQVGASIDWEVFDGPCRPQHKRNWDLWQETCYDYY